MTTTVGLATASLLPTAIAAALATSTAGAQTPPAPVVTALEEVVVTARKREERLQDVPDTITAFTAAQIERAGIDELNDYVRLTPGLSLVEASQSPGIALINIRGIGQQYQSEAPVAVVVDGVQTASVSSINQLLVDVERIEVLKGPQGALYGRNAIGGAINITTAEPADELEGRITVGYANGENERIQGMLSGALLPGKVRFRVSGAYDDFDGTFRNEVTGRHVNPLEDLALRGRVIADVSEVLRVDVRASYGRTKNAGYQAVVLPSGDTGDFSPRPRSGSPGTGERTAQEYSAKLSLQAGRGELSATSAYVDTDDRSSYDLDQQPIPFLNLERQITAIRAFSQELRFTSSAEARFRYVGGLYFLDTERARTTRLQLVPLGLELPADVRDDNRAWAVFAQGSYDLTDRFELTVAGRYDEDEREQTDLLAPSVSPTRVISETFTKAQPKVSLAFKATPEVNLYATAGRGFRSGGFNVPGPAFERVYDSEQTTNLEVGVKSTLADGRVRMSVAAFHTDYDSQQIQLLDLASGVQGIVNVDEIRNVGAEAEVVARLTDALTLSAGAGYIDSEIRAFAALPSVIGNRSPYTPEWTFNAAIDWARRLTGPWQLVARAAVSGQSGMYYEYFSRERNAALGYQLDRQPSYALVDLRLTLRTPSFSATAFADNAFDEHYYADAASNLISLGLGDLAVRGRERRYGVELSYRF